jgi:RNA polymerase sigma-70 factor (ECF subfamily)
LKTDEELIRLCSQRDGHAWESLVKRHQSRIVNLAYQFTGNAQEAEDLAQDIFVRLYEGLELFQTGRSFRTWFNSLARNLCIDEFLDLKSPTEGAEKRLERRERRELLLKALDTLGATSRDAIVMKDLQGMSLEDMAEAHDVPIGTVKSRVSRARVELGRMLIKLEKGWKPEPEHGLS